MDAGGGTSLSMAPVGAGGTEGSSGEDVELAFGVLGKSREPDAEGPVSEAELEFGDLEGGFDPREDG
jgi:hypothetical protein